MADLFSSLNLATRALEAQRFALDVTGQNIANVNTPGYSRRTVDFAAVPPDHPREAGRGVEVEGIRAQRDRLTERRLDQENSGAAREAAIADLLSVAETALGKTGQGVDARLNAFFDSMARLADAPTSAVARQEVIEQGTAVASAFRSTVSRLADLQRDADGRVTSAASQINNLAERIAALNESLAGMPPSGASLHLQDEQAKLVRELSTLTDITVIQRSEGGVDIDFAAGRTLVVGKTAYAVTASPTGPQGRVAVSLGGVDVTAQMTGGTVGGLLRARDVLIPEYVDQLDEIAFGLAQSVNAAHAAGFDLNGNTGQNFFAFDPAIVGPGGAASALVVDPAIAGTPPAVPSDPSRIAAAAVAGVPGDNRVARELADIRSALVLGGSATLADGWGTLVFTVGRDAQTATTETALRRDVVLQLEALRDQVSGVSLDEEALHLMKFQRAYEASARFFQVIDDTLDTLINTVAR